MFNRQGQYENKNHFSQNKYVYALFLVFYGCFQCHFNTIFFIC